MHTAAFRVSAANTLGHALMAPDVAATVVKEFPRSIARSRDWSTPVRQVTGNEAEPARKHRKFDGELRDLVHTKDN